METEVRPAVQQMRKIFIARVEEFPPGARMEVVIGKTPIAVFNIDGRFYAIYGRCPHQFASLSRGRLQGTVVCNAETGWETRWVYENEVVVCPGHGMEFHIKTGKAIGYRLKLPTFSIIVEDGEVKLVLHKRG